MEPIQKPDLLLIVGGIGLVINLIGLALFSGHGHSHGGGGHGHSHGSGGHEHTHGRSHVDSHKHNHAFHDASNDDSAPSRPALQFPDVAEHNDTSDKAASSAEQMNMRAVFLHVLGDALGSVVVIASALAIKYGDGSWSYYVDPGMSIVLVIIICSSSFTLLRDSSLVLLQTTPNHIEVKDLQKKIITKIRGVTAIHEFHVWQLAGERIVASAHIKCNGDLDEYNQNL